MKNRFVLLFAVLGFATLICVLLFSRDNKLRYQTREQVPASEVSAVPANAAGLSPTIETLAEVPASPVVAAPASAAPKPEASKQLSSKTEAAKAKG